ncbi:MAG: hypothetical protein LBQ12_05620, partial [Deltaproteobacteria bacterium]|nr:hypothetical protein [Deltaproteobacteria bacterium]
NVPARQFPLKVEQKEYTIYRDLAQGPVFEKSNVADLFVFNNCKALGDSQTPRFGDTCSNECRVDPRQGGYSSTALTRRFR